MATFKPRTEAPTKLNRDYIRFDKGGTNYAIQIGNDGSVLPNCVGYAWGRWSELLGKFHNISRANAEDWWAKKDGYKRSQTPSLGAVICWSKGKVGVGADGAGHVAIVEGIFPDGTIRTSNSAYKGTRFYMRDIKPPYAINGYKLQGFIHLPITFGPTKTVEELAKEVLAGKWGAGATRKTSLINAGYDYNKVQERVNQIVVEDARKKAEQEKAKAEAAKPKLTVRQVAEDIWYKGMYGTGEARKANIRKLGLDPAVVQDYINKVLSKKK